MLGYGLFVIWVIPGKNRNMGCHGNHAFSHSPNEFIFRTFFSYSGGPMEQFGINE